MYQAQESHLGGAYYGPPIPPQPYQRPRRNCFCCLFSTLVRAFIACCVLLGIIVLILWLIFRPLMIEVAVEDAVLTRFNLTNTPSNNNNLDYRLATNVSMRNPNSRIGVYYDWLEADAYYDGARFSWVELPTFYQDHKNTTTVRPLFEGSSFFVGENVGDFKSDNATGSFGVDVWLLARMRYKFGSLITRRYVARVRCGLWLKLVRNASVNSGFTRTQCDIVDY